MVRPVSTTSSATGADPTQQDRPVTSRRRFLTYLVAAPTLVVGGRFIIDTLDPATAEAAIPSLPAPADLVDLGDLLIAAALPTSNLISLQFTPDGVCHFDLPRMEVGQGITTTVSMILAEELDMSLGKVSVTLADARPELRFNQLTGSSNNVRALWGPVRALAATARAQMLGTASKQSGIAAALLSVKDGVISSADGRYTGTYGSLAVAAAGSLLSIASGNTAAPKDPSRYTLIGTPQNRVDARAIVTGAKKYTLDLAVPGAKPVYVRRPPTINGTVRKINNEATVRALEGVIDLCVIPSGVAVMAETFGQALDGLNALDVTWGGGSVDGESNDTIRAKLRQTALPLAVPGLLAQYIDAEFDWAPVSHAPMETNSAIADVRADRAEIWSGFKTPIVAAQTIAGELGLPVAKVVCHTVQSGGSFGRHLFFDAPLEAAQISKKLGRPVMLKWTRTDDVRHGRAAPASYHHVRATYVLGNVTTFEHRVASVETDFRHGLGEILSATATKLPAPLDAGNLSVSETLFETTIKSPYNYGLVTQLLTELPAQFHTGSFRSVYSFATRGSEEIIADEIAARFGQDPVAYRLSTLKTDRQRAVLRRAATEGGWGRPMPAGTAQGIAFHDEFGSCTACLVELDTTKRTTVTVYRADGTPNGTKQVIAPRVTRATIVVDVGRALNPRGLESQMIGGLTDAISIVFRAGLHVVNGSVLEGSYSEFHYARQKDSPTEVKVVVMPPTGEPGGAGELGLPAAVGSIANAYARATGTKPRSFPINFDIDFPPRPASLSPQPPFRQ